MSVALACRACLRAARVSSPRPGANHRCSSSLSTVIFRQPANHSRRRHAVISPLVTAMQRAPASSSSSSPAPPGDMDLDESASDSAKAANALRENATSFTETYVAYGATEALFKECARQADYYVPQAFDNDAEPPTNSDGEHIGQGTGWWYENLDLTPTFNTWAQVTFLHMYLLTVRLRYFPPEFAPIWLQHLHDHFFYEAEHRMTIFHGLSSRTIRNKYLKDLYNQWLGVQGAYDEGLVRGDAVLAAAVWRNIFKADDDVDWTKVALVVGFMRRGLRGLDRAKDQTLVAAMIKFGSPMSEMAIVEEEAPELKEALSSMDEKDLAEFEEETTRATAA